MRVEQIRVRRLVNVHAVAAVLLTSNVGRTRTRTAVYVQSGELARVASGNPGDGPCETDAAGLVRRAGAGDIRAFEALMARHERPVLRTALALLRNREDAKDAAQEVFLRLYNHLARIEPERALAPWLYTVTVNVCRTIARKRRKQAALRVDNAERLTPGRPTQPDAAAQTADAWRIVERGLAALPAKERAALVLRDIEGLSTREVAAILGSSEVTVRSQISRARVKLKRFRQQIIAAGNRPET